MFKKPTYEELEKMVKELKKEAEKRKQVQDELRESYQKLQTTFDAVQDNMNVVDLNFNLTDVNAPLIKRFGLSDKESLLGRKCFEVLKGRKDICPSCAVAETYRTKAPAYRTSTPEDEVSTGGRSFEIFAYPIMDHRGNICGAVEFARDITERKQVEETLRIERDNLHNIFESIENGIYIVNQEYDIQYVNQVLIKDFGPYEGIKCYKYFHDRDEVCPWCKNQDVWAGKTVRWEWYSFKNEKTYDLIDTPMTLPDGSIGKLEIFHDITDMKQAEEALKESEQKYRTLSEQFTDAIYITTRKGKLAYVNQSFLDLFGYTREEITDMKAQEMYVNPDDRPRFQQEIEKTGSVRDFEVKLHKKDGAEMDCLITATMRQADDRNILGYQGIIRNITEQKASLEMWRRYEFIVNTSKQFMTLINRDYTYEAVNEAYSLSHKKSRDEILGMKVADIWGEETFNTIIKPYIDKCLAGNEVHYQKWFELKDEELRFYDVSYYPYYGNQEDVTHAVVVTHDITEREQAGKALRESEEKYRTILESIEEGYYEVDIAGNFTFVNDSQCRILGYSRDEIIGMNNRKYMDEEGAKKVYQGFNRVFKTGIPSKVLDWELIRKDGTKRFVEISVSLIKDSEGNPTGFRGILRDVTERKLMEQNLQGERERFATLAENAPFGMSIINATGRYEYINHKFTEIFGYTLEDIPTGKLWFKVAYPDPEYRKEVISIWLNDLRGAKPGELRPREFKVSCNDGSQKDIYFRSVMLRNGNQIVTYEDITEKKLLEAQLLQAQKMEAIGTLAGGIAHNFNNLLMAIQGNTSLMLLDTTPDHPHYERLTNIEKSVQSGSKLTSQLLGYARGGRYEVKPISINRIITDTSATFSMTRKDITLHQDLEHNLSGVKADRGQIEQVVLNIYVNAAEAMVGGGELFITTRNIAHTDIKKKSYTIKPGNYILLTIRDTGIGMDKDTQAKVFDPFFTTKGLAKGTGLGLASVYGTVKAHGGYIDVESQKGQARPPRLSPAEWDDGGQGTTFFVYLPASQETIGEEVKIPGTIEKGEETILLVDDEEIILDVGEALLISLGYTVLIAQGGKEALEIVRTTLESSPPDLVILDMIMPSMGGGETYDKLKEIDPSIKVLLSSGYSINGQAKEILKRGCNGFIQKPFTLREVSKAIREVLGKG